MSFHCDFILRCVFLKDYLAVASHYPSETLFCFTIRISSLSFTDILLKHFHVSPFGLARSRSLILGGEPSLFFFRRLTKASF